MSQIGWKFDGKPFTILEVFCKGVPMTAKLETLNTILGGLMRRYQERVPDVAAIINEMVAADLIASPDEIENDHIAFRTMGVPQLGMQSFEKIFLNCGYERRDSYHFAHKKLDAFWYSPPDPKYPRIFVSELRVGDLSPEAQRIIKSYTDEVPSDPVDALDLNDGHAVDAFLHSPLWRLPTPEDFKTLQAESEYAAWVIYNRYYLNHFTVSVHNLPEPFDTCAGFNQFLESHGFKLNDSGGKVKQSPDGMLLQSSTVAEMLEVTFAGGQTQTISGSYVEFAERRVLPEFSNLPKSQIKREHRREGFEAGNADKIFESTYTTQTQKRETVQ
jgi:Domain of unknown function (DUF1338)